jgi:hypothetical protein
MDKCGKCGNAVTHLPCWFCGWASVLTPAELFTNGGYCKRDCELRSVALLLDSQKLQS